MRLSKKELELKEKLFFKCKKLLKSSKYIPSTSRAERIKLNWLENYMPHVLKYFSNPWHIVPTPLRKVTYFIVKMFCQKKWIQRSVNPLGTHTQTHIYILEVLCQIVLFSQEQKCLHKTGKKIPIISKCNATWPWASLPNSSMYEVESLKIDILLLCWKTEHYTSTSHSTLSSCKVKVVCTVFWNLELWLNLYLAILSIGKINIAGGSWCKGKIFQKNIK